MVKAFRRIHLFLLVGFLTLLFATPAGVSYAAGQSAVISQGFTSSDDSIVEASLVSTVDSDSKRVELATTKNASRLAGVVSNTSLVQLSGTSGTTKVQVAISGTASVLVSDINGGIKAGDKITISPISGVGMTAASDAQVIGTASSDFSGKGAKTMDIKDRSGKKRTVHVGTIPVQIAISYYVAPTSNILPPFLQSLANNIAGRPVSVARVLMGSVLILFAFVSIFALIFTSVRSGLISLGRNPLAAGAIQRSLVGMVITTLLIFAFSLLATYLILIF